MYYIVAYEAIRQVGLQMAIKMAPENKMHVWSGSIFTSAGNAAAGIMPPNLIYARHNFARGTVILPSGASPKVKKGIETKRIIMYGNATP